MRVPAVFGCAAIALLALGGPPAVAAPTLDGTFPTSGTPGQIAPGPDGNVWFALLDSSAGREFGKVEPDGTITEYDTPNGQLVSDLTSGPSVAGGQDDRVWMSQNGGVVEWDPVAEMGTAHAIASIGQGRGIVADGDGNLWVVDSAAASPGLVKIAPDGNEIDDVQVAGSDGRGVDLGGDGRIWWADFGNTLIRATSTTSPYTTQSYNVTAGNNTQEVAAGPANQLAYSNPSNEIGRISTEGAVQPSSTPGTDPTGVTYAADEAYWFAEFAAEKLGRLTQDGAYTQPISFPAGSGPRYIAAGPGGTTLWAALDTANAIARVSGVEPPAPPPAALGPEEISLALEIRKPRVNVRKRLLVFNLSLPAVVHLRIKRILPGRRVRGRCVRVRRGNRKRRFCRRFIKARVLRRRGRAGTNRIRLPRRLRPGRYRIVIIATASGKVDRHFAHFRIPRRNRR